MSLPGMFRPGSVPDLDLQLKRARKARAAGRHWILRGVLLLVIAGVAFTRGGSLMITVGVVSIILAILSASLGSQTRSQAIEIEKKIRLMQQGSERSGEAGTVEEKGGSA